MLAAVRFSQRIWEQLRTSIPSDCFPTNVPLQSPHTYYLLPRLHFYLYSRTFDAYLLMQPNGTKDEIPYFPAHKTHRDFFVRNLRKNNDECILILVIYWKKTGLLHAKISNHNIIYSSEIPRKSSSLPLRSSSWLFSLDESLSSCKMSSSLPSTGLLMPHFLKDFTIVPLLTRCQKFFTHFCGWYCIIDVRVFISLKIILTLGA